MNYSLINPEDVAPYLQKYADTAEIGCFLTIALEDSIKKYPNCMRKVDSLPKNASKWLKEAWKSNLQWYEFYPKQDIRLPGRIAIVCKWIEQSIDNQEKWVSETDKKGRPVKLVKIRSLQDAIDMALEYEKSLQDKKIQSSDYDVLGVDIQFVSQITDTVHVVSLHSTKALMKEEFFLKHNVGEEELQNTSISGLYSFRNQKNEPLMTLQVDPSTNHFIKCRTENNRPAYGTLLEYLNIFTKKLNIQATQATVDFYLYEDGHFLDTHNLSQTSLIPGSIYYHHPNQKVHLAKKTLVSGSLDFYGYALKQIQLPDDLKVEENLSFSACPFLKTLPKKISVGGNFDLLYCNKVEVVPDLENIKGRYWISGCSNITDIQGEYLNVDELYLEYCPNLIKIPDSVICHGFCSFVGCDSLKALPKKLHAKAGLRIIGCKSLRLLPEDFFLKGNIYTEYGVFESVEVYRMAFKKISSN